MFEKEAIRHAFEVTIGLDCLIKPAEEFTYEELSDHLQEKADDFQDGAEFGYNKAKEEMIQNGLALQSDMDKTIEQNIALKKELNKANEWHYLSKGETDEKFRTKQVVTSHIADLEKENYDLQQKWLSESYEKSILVKDNDVLRQIILGNEEEISELKEIIKNLIRPLTEEEKHLTIDVRHKWIEKAKQILREG